jgi:hypothetical protein
LSANTNYFAYSFTGQSVPDRLKIIYSGGTTPSQVILEDINIGQQVPTTNWSWSQPRQYNGTNFKKVLCLTGLTRIPGDSLSIQIIPNNGATEWALNLRCLSSFNCDTCQAQYLNSSTPYKIIASAITAITATCFTLIGVKVSGCTNNTQFSDFNQYWSAGATGGVTGFNGFLYVNAISNDISGGGIIPASGASSNNYMTANGTNQKLSYVSNDCSATNFGFPGPTGFSIGPNTPSGTISFSKFLSGTSPSVGVIQMEFDSTYWLNYYYSSYLSRISLSSEYGISGCTATATTSDYGTFYPKTIFPVASPTFGPFSGGTWTGGTTSPFNKTDRRYYRGLRLCVPSATGNSQTFSNTADGSGQGFTGNAGNGLAQCYTIHTSALVTTGITGSNYYMRIVMNTIEDGLTFSPCQPICTSSKTNCINAINGSSTATTNNISFTTTVPAVFGNPFETTSRLFIPIDFTGYTGGFSATCRSITRASAIGNMYWYDSINYTVPQNPSNGQAIPQYSGVTCPNLQRRTFSLDFSSGNTSNRNTSLLLFNYYVQLLDTPGYKDYEIYCIPMTNGIVQGTSTTDNNIGSLYPTISNPNWQLAYRFQNGVATFCNSTYVIC